MKKRVLIFLIIGLVLYYLDLSINSDQDKDVYISDQEIISLITAWESQVGRTPNDNEIARIINNLVEEEILYREALNLGLEKDDRIIKRRLAQKISFLKQESIKEALLKKMSSNILMKTKKNTLLIQYSLLHIIFFLLKINQRKDHLRHTQIFKIMFL